MVDVIGVFDSGVGGLGVLRRIRDELPDADIMYFADQANAPYGTRSLDEVAEAASDVTRQLADNGASTVVVACNTASAAALDLLRSEFPQIEFVGMEPAVKPAAFHTRTGVIGVLATEATFSGEMFASVVGQHAAGIEVIPVACPEWVDMVEDGRTSGVAARLMVANRVGPITRRGADCLVLGCTHFPFLAPLIREVSAPRVSILDPAPAVARQVRRVYGSREGTGSITLATSGDPDIFAEQARQLVGLQSRVLAWVGHGYSNRS